MRGRLTQKWEKVRGSYWFLPSLMTLGAVLMSFLMLRVDQQLGAGWIEDWRYIYSNKPDGARSVLSTISGAMLGVAGVTFSITIAAVAYASSSFGPRIIKNFMRDTGNQVTLGTFIATYVYCLMVLRTVRSGDEGGGFVPHLSVFFGVLLALASLGVLIFFIHHIPESIHVDHVVSGIGKEMLRKADSLYPEEIDEVALETGAHGERFPAGEAGAVRATCDGYIQSIDQDGLRRLAREHSLNLSLSREPGEFVPVGGRLLEFRPANAAESDDHLRAELTGAFVQGDDRSPTQDLLYLIDQMNDVAARALSPGINDPFTAMSSIDWLCALLSKLARKRFPEQEWAEGSARIRQAKAIGFERYVAAVWDRLRPYVEKDRNAALHMLDRGLAILPDLSPGRSVALILAMQSLVEGCLRHFDHSRDIAELEQRRQSLQRLSSSSALLPASGELRG